MKKAQRVLPLAPQQNCRLRAPNGGRAVTKTGFSGGKRSFFGLEGHLQKRCEARNFCNFFRIFCCFSSCFCRFYQFFWRFFRFFRSFFRFFRRFVRKAGNLRVLPRGNSKKICGGACLVRCNRFSLFPYRFILYDGLEVRRPRISTFGKIVVRLVDSGELRATNKQRFPVKMASQLCGSLSLVHEPHTFFQREFLMKRSTT